MNHPHEEKVSSLYSEGKGVQQLEEALGNVRGVSHRDLRSDVSGGQTCIQGIRRQTQRSKPMPAINPVTSCQADRPQIQATSYQTASQPSRLLTRQPHNLELGI